MADYGQGAEESLGTYTEGSGRGRLQRNFPKISRKSKLKQENKNGQSITGAHPRG
jgi:hypothetical protein